jgi:uncharacterized membrane protein
MSSTDSLVAPPTMVEERPAAQQPEVRAARKPGVRFLSFDILRTLAILVMICEHFSENWSENIAPPEWADFVWFAGQLPPAFFVLLVGLSYSLWLGVQKRAGRSEDEIVKYSLRRGFAVLALGFAVNIFLWKPETTFHWDILLLIGASSLILVPLRNWRPGILIGLCIAIVLVSPLLRDFVNFDSFWDEDEFVFTTMSLSEVSLAALATGHFPLFPWLIYSVVGFALGEMYYRPENEGRVPRIILVAGVVIFALALLGLLLHHEFASYLPDWLTRHYATPWPSTLYPWVTVAAVGWVGITMIALWVLNRTVDLNPNVNPRGFVMTFFQRYSMYALTAYVAHLAVSIWILEGTAWWVGVRPDYYFGIFATTPTALLSAVAFIIVFYIGLIFLDRYRKYTLENFIRWISS